MLITGQEFAEGEMGLRYPHHGVIFVKTVPTWMFCPEQSLNQGLELSEQHWPWGLFGKFLVCGVWDLPHLRLGITYAFRRGGPPFSASTVASLDSPVHLRSLWISICPFHHS